MEATKPEVEAVRGRTYSFIIIIRMHIFIPSSLVTTKNEYSCKNENLSHE